MDLRHSGLSFPSLYQPEQIVVEIYQPRKCFKLYLLRETMVSPLVQQQTTGWLVGARFPALAGHFSFCVSWRPPLGPTQRRFQCVLRALSPGFKAALLKLKGEWTNKRMIK
jgi:hypothetical protein